MGFNRDSKNSHANQDSMWTSYSDLFLGLSVIFLLLYVAASLRQGTEGVRQVLDNKTLAKENADLKQQLKVYESLKTNYLNTQASGEEQDTYEVLMKKLELLQEQAIDKKNELQAEAKENENEGKALNQYQQVIRNIINANMIAKARIKNRDSSLDEKDEVIDVKSKEISSLEDDLKLKSNEIQKSNNKITSLSNELDKNLSELKVAYKKNQITENRFKEQQAVIKREAQEKIAYIKQQNLQQEAELADMKAQQGELAGKLTEATGKLSEAKGKLTEASGRLSAAEGKYSASQKELSETKSALGKARENLYARKRIADAIKSKFKASGVDAEVDPGTGDVLLGFGAEYFDTGDSKLKPGMRNTLEKALPAYAQSLFEDPKVSDKIENVEIVGFASPTFKGKYIDPSSLNKKDRMAVNFNLDLSYKRARSIFDHLYTNMDFQQKQRLLPLIKVTGRSFLGDKAEKDNAVAMGFCQKNDCAKKQTVIIKFKLRD